MDAALALYRTLGLTFTQEQHGAGPIHHSCDMDGTVLEIYPSSEGGAPDRRAGGATSLGFRVPSVDAVLSALKPLGTPVITPPKDSQWGRRAVVADPDGRAVEILSSNGK
ncbi:MAG: bleomycin resistance protein [Pedosphaera sp.]|nr:bleomycin resistance protein [Pedosphaera sp.]